MAFTKYSQAYLTDLFAHEVSHYPAYAAEELEVTLTEDVKMGQLVFATDVGEKYVPVTSANLATALVKGNLFGVLFGDNYSHNVEIAKETEKAIAVVRGMIQLKDKLIMESVGITDRTTDEYKKMKELLGAQGVIIVPVAANVPYGV